MANSSSSHNKGHLSTYFVQDRSNNEALQHLQLQDQREGEPPQRLSWNELNKNIEQQDWLIEGRLTLTIEVSIERLHLDQKKQAGNEDTLLGKSWLASLVLSPPGPGEQPFPDGESFMLAD